MRGKLPMVIVLIASLVTLFFADSALATHQTTTYQYLIGTGFLCDLDPSACPVITMASNGDKVEISGEGTFTLHRGRGIAVSGGGMLVHKLADGTVIGSGEWEALELLHFRPYGTSPDFPPTFEGGKAIMKVAITPTGSDTPIEGFLRVDCLIGNFPSGAKEGVTLAIPGIINFSEEVSGFTLFIRQE